MKHSRELFGGDNIIAVGDLRHKYGPIATNLWCEDFTMYEVEEIMCQKDEKGFAELLNRLHRGKHTIANLNLLSSRQ